jgi:D-gamma-glutamyl-meso-diaminopimelic acid endopeptidase CwlS
MRTIPVRSVLPILGLSALLVIALLLCAATALPSVGLVAGADRFSSNSILAAGTATPSPTITRTPTATPSPTVTRTRFVPGPTFTPSLTPGPGNYVVQPGDYLFKIARLLDTTVIGLKAINHLSSDEIYVGQVLAIPSPLPTKIKTATPTLMAGGQYYMVQPGDQLLPIARLFGVTVPNLKTANNLSSDTIFIGQVLVIPPPTAPPATRTPFPLDRTNVVQEGDQLGFIARRYGVTVTQIRIANGLTSNTIFPEQVLYIPLPGPAATQPPAPTAVPSGAVVYIVKLGDRLSIIALWYGVSQASIKTTNSMSSNAVYIGQALVILNPPLRPVGYIVQRGDTLESLAQRFGTTVDTIRMANKMGADQSTIFAGLTLIIPTANW